MVWKEEICGWFAKADGWQRIDLMCKLMQQCTALELRFIGSCVEDRARKDFHGLRECELKANDANEFRKLSHDINDERTRSYLNIYMSLLYSINTQCAHIMFELITSIEAKLSSFGGGETTQKFAEDVLLLYTMAAYHPAFSFHQRQKLWDCLRGIESKYGDAVKKTPVEVVTEEREELSAASSITIPVTSHHGNPCLKHNVDAKSVHVSEIELKGSQWKADERRFEFHLQVTWSDGDVTESWRTYHDVYSFHAELIRLFPNDSGAHKQERHIPFLPQNCSRSERHVSIDAEEMKLYIRELSSVPEHIIKCSHMTNFFRSGNKRSTASPVHVNSNEELEAQGDQLSQKLVTGQVLHSPPSPQNTATHKHSYSSATPSPSGSPLPSPQGSPRVSPAQSVSSRASSPRPGLTIAQWLKALRLHKYTDSLRQYNWAEVFKLSDMDLEKIGLTVGARKKLRCEIEQLKKKTVGLNGVSCAAPGGGGDSPSSPDTWHTPPGSASYLPSQGGATKSLSPSSSVESSPSCSEYSSPPLSPLSHGSKAATHASIDDIDREESEDKLDCMMNPPRQQHQQQQPSPSHDQSKPLAPPADSATTNSSTSFVPISNSVEPLQAPPVNLISNSVEPLQAPPVNLHNYPPLAAYPRPQSVHTRADVTATSHAYSSRHQGSQARSPRAQGTKVVHHLSNTTQMAVSLPVNGYGGAGDGAHTTKGSMMHPPEGVVATASNTVLPGHVAAVPMATSLAMGGTSIARPTTLGVHVPMIVPGSMSSTNVTYTIAPGTSIPPPTGLDVKNVMHGMTLSTSAEVSGAYTLYHQGASTTSSTVTYTSPGFQPATTPLSGPLSGPMSGGMRQSPSPAGTSSQSSASPAPAHVPGHGVPTPTPTTVPTANPTPNGSAGCSSCGCSGNCGPAAPTPPTYQYNIPHVWPHNHVMATHHGFPPHLGFAVTSNGILPHSLPANLPFSPHHLQQQPPHFSLPNGVTPEVLYNNQSSFAMMQQQQQQQQQQQPLGGSGGAHHPGGHYMGSHLPFVPGLSHTAAAAAHMGLSVPGVGGKLRNTSATCHNCGVSGHRAPECKEATMESMTRSAQYHLNLKPKAEGE